MAVKPENTFRGSVHKYLPPDLYHVKMNNQFAAGIPDDYYSGPKADLWIEYKFIPKITPVQVKLPELSALQLDWLNQRHEEGRNVAVIVGSKDGGVLYLDQEWEIENTVEEFKRSLLTRAELAKWILTFTRGSP